MAAKAARHRHEWNLLVMCFKGNGSGLSISARLYACAWCGRLKTVTLVDTPRAKLGRTAYMEDKP